MTSLIQEYPFVTVLIVFLAGGWVGFLGACLAVASARADRNQ